MISGAQIHCCCRCFLTSGRRLSGALGYNKMECFRMILPSGSSALSLPQQVSTMQANTSHTLHDASLGRSSPEVPIAHPHGLLYLWQHVLLADEGNDRVGLCEIALHYTLHHLIPMISHQYPDIHLLNWHPCLASNHYASQHSITTQLYHSR
jgi:hypothetical protein